MQSYSIVSLLRGASTGHRKWNVAWRDSKPRASYDVVVVGGGGHGLATAYYLAREYGITNVAVLEAGWIGGGNTGRNTAVIRSNYLYPESAAFYDFSLKLFENLGREINFNVMFRQGGVLTLMHDRHQLETMRRNLNAMHMNGIGAEWIRPETVKSLVPPINLKGRYPVLGAIIQKRGGIARHDAVAWGYARAADDLGVDIIQGCSVTGFDIARGAVQGVRTSLGEIRTKKVALAVAGYSSVLADMAGFRLPVTSYCLQAMVSEPLKPVFDPVLISPSYGVYVSQSDKGEMVIGGNLDLFPSYAQRGDIGTVEHVLAGVADLFPGLRSVKLMRCWGGTVDVVHDSSPIIGSTPVDGIYINCGFGTGGFKATPAGGFTLAHAAATGRAHPLAEPFSLERFSTGRMIDEASAAGIAH